MSSPSTPSDKGAAFTGLIVTAIALVVICFSIVKWTNARFASHGDEKAEATTSH